MVIQLRFGGLIRFTPSELLILRAARDVLSARISGDYEMVVISADDGAAIAVFTLGYHTDASFALTKDRREYVWTRWDGAVVSRGPTLMDALSAVLDARHGHVQRHLMIEGV